MYNNENQEINQSLMILEHKGKKPSIHPTAYIAPNATICGDVTIGANSRIMFGAQIIAENNSISIGENCIVLENAVLRSVIPGKNCHPTNTNRYGPFKKNSPI